MKALGSHPGAILFRFVLTVVLIVTLIAVFFSYLEDTERELERVSISQTKKIIDSALAVVFASYATSGRLDELNELDGGNPFVFLQEFGIAPPGYRRVLNRDLTADLEPGWYYLEHRRLVAYKSYFIDSDTYFAIRLSYDDLNASGHFEREVDRFRNLYFVRAIEIAH